MISTSYPRDLGDWRGVFIRHLVGAIARVGGIQLSLWAPPGEIPEQVRYAANCAESDWLARLMQAGGIAHLARTGGMKGWQAPIRLLRMLRALYRRESGQDLYHVNWLQNALALPNDGRALLATVLGTDMQLLGLPGMTSLLRRVFRHRKVAICPNATWMVPELERRFGDLAHIRYLPFGIEPQWYEVRRTPTAPTKWLCVSRVTRKKIGDLFAWSEHSFARGKRELHLFGPMQQAMHVPPWVHYHGTATADSLCNDWFPKAQGLITLSQHAEGRPQVMLEAMAAGLPIVASSIPAHRDMLEDRKTGWLCNSADEVDAALAALDGPLLNRELGENARNWAKRYIGDWDACALRYVEIYELLVQT